MSQYFELVSSQLSENQNSSTKEDADEKQQDNAQHMQAEVKDSRIGGDFEAQIPLKQSTPHQQSYHRNRLNRLKIWDSKSNISEQQIQQTSKLIRRKFGRILYNQEDIYTLLQRTKLDLPLINEMLVYEEKFMKNYLQLRSSQMNPE